LLVANVVLVGALGALYLVGGATGNVGGELVHALASAGEQARATTSTTLFVETGQPITSGCSRRSPWSDVGLGWCRSPFEPEVGEYDQGQVDHQGPASDAGGEQAKQERDHDACDDP